MQKPNNIGQSTLLTIVYPHGEGGHWLGNLFYSLITDNWSLTQPDLFFHDYRVYPQTTAFNLIHAGEELETFKVIGSFCSYRSQYHSFCNGYYKIWKEKRQDLNLLDQLLALEQDVHWRLNLDFNKTYLNNILIESNLIFDDPENFIDQVYKLLDTYNISHYSNTEYAYKAIDNFKNTCWGNKVLGDTNSLAWLAWCCGVGRHNNIDVPIFENRYVDYIKENNEYFIKYTQENFAV